MRATSCVLLLMSLAAGCVSPPPPPAAGKAQLWGVIKGAPKEGLRSGVDGTAYHPERDDPALPRGVRLVDYDHIGPVLVQLRGPAPAPTTPVTLTLGPAGFTGFGVVGAGGQLVIANRSGQPYTFYARRDDQTAFEVVVADGADSPPQPVGAEPGTLELFTYESERVAARLLVAGGPFQHVAEGQRYVLDDLPPGKYRLIAWHPRLPPIVRELELTAGQQVREDLTFSVNALPKVER